MPGFDQTGPKGKGPGTGRGLGICPPEEKYKRKNTPLKKVPIDEMSYGPLGRGRGGPGKGLGRRRGPGRGLGRGLGRGPRGR